VSQPVDRPRRAWCLLLCRRGQGDEVAPLRWPVAPPAAPFLSVQPPGVHAAVKLSAADFEQHLQEKLAWLVKFARHYDAGDASASGFLAVVIRTLVHKSGSLLAQLNLQDTMEFLNTAREYEEPVERLERRGDRVARVFPQHIPFNGLAVMQTGPRVEFAPLCAAPPLPFDWRSFLAWWDQTVVVDKDRRRFSRAGLVLDLANKDVAHVTPTLPGAYAALTRKNSMGWAWRGPDGSGGTVDGVHTASCRQIAHELFWSIVRVRPHLSVPAE
jgi:hypothetical protein